MSKMKYWNGSTWVALDASNADTVAGKTPGAMNGIATLGADGKVTSTQLPATSSQRTTTLVVAASNSTVNGKTGADYVCDGVDDHVEINNALTALPFVIADTGTAQAGAASTITLATTASAVDVFYNGHIVEITSGTGVGQTATISGYVGSTRVATVSTAWGTIPDATSVYAIKTKSGKVVLLEGNFTVGASINVPSNVTLEGQGNGTVIKLKDGTSGTMGVIKDADPNGNSGIRVSKLKIDGNKSKKTSGNVYGVYFTTAYNSSVDDVFIVNSTYGIYVANAADYNSVLNNTCQENSTGMYIAGNQNRMIANLCKGNSNTGINLNAGGSNNLVLGNTMQGNTFNGISCSTSYNMILNNYIQGNGTHGISLTSSHNLVTGNICLENSQTTNANADNINVADGPNNIQGNTCRQGALTNKPAYGIRIASGTGNFVTNNDLTTGGATGAFSDIGTGTITTAGNKLA